MEIKNVTHWGRRMNIVFRLCLAGAACFVSVRVAGQSFSSTFVDVGTPSVSSGIYGDPTAAASQITTTALGVGAVSGGDQVAFAYQATKATGHVDWIQPAVADAEPGRLQGLMVRSSLSAQSPMVFFGYQCDSNSVPQLSLLWRKAGASAVHAPITLEDTGLRTCLVKLA